MIDPIPSKSSLASVIIPCVNRLEVTRQCVTSLARHTRPPWELIVIDDGSTDGTSSYLAGIGDIAPFPVTVLTNTEPRGFAACCNQGIVAARGAFLALLSNEVVVTDGWLDQLLALSEVESAVGMVGAMSNGTGPPQLVADTTYPNRQEMERFAAAWRSRHRGQWFFADVLSGACLLIQRRVIERIGGLTGRPGPGRFDEVGFAQRAREVGFKLAVAADLFVYHSQGRILGGGRSGLATDSNSSARVDAIPNAVVPADPTTHPDDAGKTWALPMVRAATGQPHPGWTKLFGVGLPRTGTTSVACAMLELGLKTAHSCFDAALFDLGDAFFDTPVYADYPELDRRFPGSKFVLTWRNPRAWYGSFLRNLGPYLHRLRTQPDLDPDRCVDRRCYAQVFGSNEIGEDTFLACYHDHRNRVERYFADRPEDLLVFDLDATADFWKPICRFLNLPMPDWPFPRINAGAIDRWLALRHPLKVTSPPQRTQGEVG